MSRKRRNELRALAWYIWEMLKLGAVLAGVYAEILILYVAFAG